MRLPAGFFRQLGLAGNRSCPQVLLLDLAAATVHEDVRAELAGRSELPEATLARMVETGGPRARFNVVGNAVCPAEVLLDIYFRQRRSAESVSMDHAHLSAALEAVEHRNFPPDVLALLARGFAPLVPGGHDAVVAAMKNPSLPTDCALLGAMDSRLAVRAALATNPAISVRTAQSLRLDQHPEVRLVLARNPAIPADVVEALNGDPDLRVRCASAERADLAPSRRELLILSVVELCPDVVAGLADLPLELIQRLFGLVSDKGWRALAENASVPGSLVEQMRAQAASAERRKWTEPALLRRRDCPPDVLDAFAADDDFRRRALAAASPALSSRHRNLLLNDGHALVRSKIAANPTTPLNVLETLSRDAERSMRVGVARNRSTSPALLALLSRDDDRMVALAAARNPNLPMTEMRAIVQESADAT